MFLLDCIVLGGLFVALMHRKWKNESMDRRILHAVLYLYLTGVVFVTLMPVLAALPHLLDHPYKPMDLVLFDDYIHRWGEPLKQIILNVILLIPFGFLYPQLCKGKWRFLKTFLAAVLISLSIELLQPLLHVDRASDITDVVTNAAGSIVGYILYLMFGPLCAKLLQKLAGKEEMNNGDS